jgi:hypothetical protein
MNKFNNNNSEDITNKKKVDFTRQFYFVPDNGTVDDKTKTILNKILGSSGQMKGWYVTSMEDLNKLKKEKIGIEVMLNI